MNAHPEFELFYAAVNEGRSPFPWQTRLAKEVVAAGWRDEIGVPTGLGKTSCLDIAVWALAGLASRPAAERMLPTRIWYVVNRRLLVDAAYDHGERLAELLRSVDESSDPVAVLRWDNATPAHVVAVAAVGEALRSIRGEVRTVDDEPLVVTRLRGGAELGARPPHPAQPALIFATVPMFASTWLFRGYASSRSMRPIDAAHAGTDSLVLLDEAHLSRPLRDLGSPLAQCDIGDPAAVVNAARSRPTVVSLTATGDAAEPFELDEIDLAHHVVRQRLDAAKRVRLRSVANKSAVVTGIVQAVRDEVGDRVSPVATVVFTNTPATARVVRDALAADSTKARSPLAGADIRLLTGRMRRREADLARAAVLDRETGAPSGRDRAVPRAGHLVVVATQTLEVGADLDFDVLVTESCGTRALIQRLGRLNRLGEAPSATGVVVHPTGESEFGLYGDEPVRVWERLQAADLDCDGIIDMPPGVVTEVLGDPEDRPARVAELLPAHLWEWAKTTTPPPGEAPVEVFYEGFATDGPRLSICWRATRFSVEDRLLPSVSLDESVDLPLYEAREVLRERFPDGGLIRLAPDRVKVAKPCTADELRPGDVVVLHVDAGLYDDHGWSPSCTEPVLDVSIDRWPGVPLDVETLRHWAAGGALPDEATLLVKRAIAGDDDLDVDDVATSMREVKPREEVGDAWRTLMEDMRPSIDPSERVPFLERKRQGPMWRGSMLAAADALDDLCAGVGSAALDDHLASVGAIAVQLGRAVGLPDDLVCAVEAAGRFHDLGKADPRFQRWLDPRGLATGDLAKSATPPTRWRAERAASGWPSGGRHEALSGRLVTRWLRENDVQDWDSDLVIHLVVTHHGFGRPLIPPVTDDSSTEWTGTLEGAAVPMSGDLGVADWDQPARFRRCCKRYGYWGLALLEAIVRQADHMASSQVVGVA